MLYYASNPRQVKKRLLRFREAFLRLGPGCDFVVVSYDGSRPTTVHQLELDGVAVTHFVFGPDAVDRLGYPVKGAARPFKLIPGNCDLVHVMARKALPQYVQYWSAEDDVDYSGDVYDVFAGLNHREGDLLAAHLAHGTDSWTYASMLHSPKGPMTAAQSWLVFLTFFRISGAALDTIDRYYRDGWSGHSENMWATILKDAGMSVIDFGGDGQYVAEEDRNVRYYGLPNDGFDKHGSFGTKTIRLRVGSRQNVLWHPIKPFKAWVRQNRKRLVSILKWQLAKFSGRRA